ncbi:MAG: hypothetical protein J1E02_09050 [Coprobacter sp.]|nr:hypothetical protein [Coprobacter sp.]
MKKMLFSAAVLVSAMFTACNSQLTEVARLRQEVDSLAQANARSRADFDEMLKLMNDVEDGFRQIKEAENYLTVQHAADSEMNLSTRDQLTNDMQLVTQILKENKEKLEKLEKQLKNSNYQSAQLQKTIERLNAEIESKTEMIVSLQEDLARRDIRIQELDSAVAELSGRVTRLVEETEEQSNTISRQDQTLNTVYYVFGTTKELKEQNIISGGGLFKSENVLKGDFNKNYFTAKDMRNFRQLPLESKKAKVITTHPESSYTLQKGSDGLLTLLISDPAAFWSVSKYLVVKVD